MRSEFRKAVAQMFGGENNIPANVLAAMSLKDYQKGKPLTADRILDVYAAIKDHIVTQKNAAFANGTLRALDIDGMPVLITEAEDDVLLVSGLVGDPPPEGCEAFCNLMLEANAGFFDAAPCALARNPESGCYMLLKRFAKASLDPESFAQELAAFADTLAEWRESLESFRPAVAAAAEMKRNDSPIRLSPDGFIEV